MLETNPKSRQVPPHPPPTFDLIPANIFTLKELTDIYNQSRIDYVVPMPMSETKLREYIDNYDIKLQFSTVAMAGNEPLGLGMLGVRGDKTWVTRLGVIPNGRKSGVGRGIMNKLIANSKMLKAKVMVLEVIKNNTPALRLFENLGFRALRELLVIRRPPAPLNMTVINGGLYIEQVGYQEALKYLATRTDTPSWVTANESLYNAGNLSALIADIPGVGRGWLVYQNTVFQLGRLVLHTDTEQPFKIAEMLLQHLHWRHPVQDTIVENLPRTDRHWPAFQALNYIISFVRTEMRLDLKEH